MISPVEAQAEPKSCECPAGLLLESPEVPLPLEALVEPPAVAPERFEALAVELQGRKTKCLPLPLVEILQIRSRCQLLLRDPYPEPMRQRTLLVPFGLPELFLGH